MKMEIYLMQINGTVFNKTIVRHLVIGCPASCPLPVGQCRVPGLVTKVIGGLSFVSQQVNQCTETNNNSLYLIQYKIYASLKCKMWNVFICENFK